jgi:hypothetical protein
MSNDKTPSDYEVGYGKPPKNTQFQKGVSGNPRGRSKKSLDADHELIRESKSFMTINENGKRKRISKHKVVVKQLTKQAMTGNTQALRIYFNLHQQAHERVALATEPRPSDPGRYGDPSSLTNEELERIILASRKDTEQESGK